MSHRYQSGRATGSVLLLLVALTAAGVWNYHRNWQVEKASEGNRPYREYAIRDLESLRAAYDSELVAVRATFDSARRLRARPARDVGSIAGNVEQFQETTRASSAIREAAGEVADREGQIKELDRELENRLKFGEGMTRHIKRLTTI